MSEKELRPEERIADEPEGPVGDLKAIVVPDVRKRSHWRKVRRLMVLFAIAGLVLIAIVWIDRWHQKREVERTIREQYALRANGAVASLELKRVGWSLFRGRLVDESGQEHLVMARAEGKFIEWRTQLPLEARRREIREFFEKDGRPVESVELRLEGDVYLGKVVFRNGDEIELREREDDQGKIESEWEHTLPTVEKWVSEKALRSHHDVVGSIVLSRESKETYLGSCKGESGVGYLVQVEPHPVLRGIIHTQLRPTPEHVERWLLHQVEKTNDVKVNSLALKKRLEGDYAGQLVFGGLIWNVRAGTPPVWQETWKKALFVWGTSLAPESYGDWVKRLLEARYDIGFEPVKLSPREGEYVGIATDEDGLRYRVKVWRSEEKREGEEAGWPELGGPPMWEAVPLK